MRLNTNKRLNHTLFINLTVPEWCVGRTLPIGLNYQKKSDLNNFVISFTRNQQGDFISFPRASVAGKGRWRVETRRNLLACIE